MKKPTMRALTPTQLDTLAAFYYGEVRAELVQTYHNGDKRVQTWVYYIEALITSRPESLFRRRLARRRADAYGQLLITITPKGIEELRKHGEL